MSLLTVEVRGDGVVEWHATADGVVTRRNTTYRPTVYVGGPTAALADLETMILDDPKVVTTGSEQQYRTLAADDRSDVLRVDLERVGEIRTFAHEVRHHYEPQAFQPATFSLYNVDFSPQFRYCLETRTRPVPARELRLLELTLPEQHLAAEAVDQLRLDGDPIAGNTAVVLRVVRERLRSHDPDVLLLSSAQLVPLLHETAASVGVEPFHLGRGPGYQQLAGTSTFESYGRVGHSPARFAVPGRALIDRSNSFMLARGGLPGILDLVERSWKPIQETAWGSIGNILTAIQIREAMSRDVLVPWNKWDAEAFKTVEQLHAADRGGYIFSPEVGVHEDVSEVDFASLYPTIMCEFNISPETVDCDCHDGEDVPGLGYSLCDERGFLPDVLRPIIDDRAALKERIAAADDPSEVTRLEGRSDALKWILVSCFGYQGYRNAKFGRIECHEAINAFAREIMLDAKDRLEAGGWRVIHGIVDSLWVTPREASPEPLADICVDISESVGIRLEHENDFEWVAFVPKRDSEAGALTKYFGKVAGRDEYKFRGIETRQRSTPDYIATVQERLVETYDRTRDPEAVVEELQLALTVLRRGDVDPSELVCRARTSKPLEAYTQRTLTVAALLRARHLGIERSPGQDVTYVVADDDARGRYRVRLPFEALEEYDAEYYATELIRAATSVLSPMGYDEARVRRALRETTDRTLGSFT
ncbi:type B DNA-directed DNA polymerase [Halorarius litoreus]|uniref:type B DNA-directed DNA polymerase n=1 Tax=Halorarius litoreus TaxID=2962676 RepID=UPI0020CE863F|nr:type B DNA-directed DNA polymerase [Halorarius litoreus]